MPSSTTRRGLFGAIAALGVGGAAVSPVRSYLERFAPLSGQVWDGARRSIPAEVESPYGAATVSYDDHHVPRVDAETEAAAYYAVGYLHAADRLFQMDLIRRLMRGELSAVVGEQALASDEFNVRMDFLGAAQASEDALEGTDVSRLSDAYKDGVNRYLETGSLPVEFGLLGYEPDPWRRVDSLLVGRQISWGLTGSFRTLQAAVLRQRFDAATVRELYPLHLDHDAPIIREGRTGGEVSGTDGDRLGEPVDPALVDWLSQFEPPPFLGSNNWVVSGEHTASGEPIVCNDPHLTLQAPPVWYQQRISAGGVDVRGVALPGVPFVIIGENEHGAWGFTNVGADVIDFYTYETDDPELVEATDRTIEVAGGDDRTITVSKTRHGPFLEREVGGETHRIAVAWTGLSATKEAAAVHAFSRAEGVEDFRSALRDFDAPTQNAVYADADGNTLYHVTGRIPIRRIGGEVVRGDRVFDGTAGEAEWEGFTPYGESSWDGFVPFDEKPGVVNPEYLATANQRVVDDPAYPIGQWFASPFRGMRIYERLDRAVDEGRAIDTAFMQDLQHDTLDVRARLLVPAIIDARDRMPDRAAPWLDALADWDYRMDRDSGAALAFARWYERFREATWAEYFEDVGLDDSYWPQEWVLVNLPPDSEYFDGDRAAVMAEAMGAAVDEIDDEGWEVYGDYNRTVFDHPFGGQVSALNYPRLPTDGSPATVKNFRRDGQAGSSWRMISSMDGESLGIVPGGNDGSYFSEHYHDQLRMWSDGEYISMLYGDGDVDVTFVEGDR